MVYIIVVLFFLSMLMLMYAILSILFKNKIRIESRLEQLKQIQDEVKTIEENKSFTERALMPIYDTISGLILKAAPRHNIEAINRKLERAGMLKNITAEKWLFRKVISMIMLSSVLSMLSYMIKPNFMNTILIFMLLILLSNTLSNFYLTKKVETRKKNILRELPYTLDLITVSVEAGLSFDGAMARVINNIKGDLCDEFSKSLKEVRMGIERKVALKNMSERCNVKELSMLVTSLNQADDLGVSLGRVLRIEAVNMREYRKQVAKEKAMKAPIKMLFPLIFFIFPSIFIIILGPAVIRVYNIFFAG